MKTGNKRTFLLTAVVFSILSPDMLVTVAQAQTQGFGEKMVEALGIFIAPFAIMVCRRIYVDHLQRQLLFAAKLSLKTM
jgi:threonine/homoserine/homoserine lactone efflux protein